MSDLLFTIVLALAWFGAVNLALSAVAAATGWLIERGAVRPRGTAVPAVLFGLKLLPGVGSLAFTLVVFLPAQWRFEPKGADESLGYTLGAFAALGAITIALAARRTLRDGRLTRTLERDWQARASGPRLADGALPVYCLPDAAPIISLAGVRRPRVFVARPVLDALSADELALSLAHEGAHHDAHDNLKRVLVASSPDLLSFWPTGHRLERRWRMAAEFAADARAVNGSEARAVSLASALLKVARLTPAPSAPPAGSGFYDGTLLWARIGRLLAPGVSPAPPPTISRTWSLSIAGMTALAAIAAAEGVWFGVHLATEGLVRFLP